MVRSLITLFAASTFTLIRVQAAAAGQLHLPRPAYVPNHIADPSYVRRGGCLPMHADRTSTGGKPAGISMQRRSLARRCSIVAQPESCNFCCCSPAAWQVRIFDTTLRDGEQSPGCTITSKEKLAIAKQLAKLGERKGTGNGAFSLCYSCAS